ncbi:MAG: SGNH/GDSL hydrolase family protein [Verrucomicrobia bacterium]|nr:SGNH/GDSL hydrolase family protein [Verrucomicrobiota bacterium]
MLAALAVAAVALWRESAEPSPGLGPSWHLHPPAYVGAKSFLALGDSYTIGEGVPRAQGWPYQLAAALRTRGIDLSDPHLLAKTGWTCSQVTSALESHLPASDPRVFDLVTVLIGVNDQYAGRSAADFRSCLERILDAAERRAAGRRERVLVVSIPDWSVTPFGANHPRAAATPQEIAAFNAVLAEVCRARELVFVEVTDLSRDSAQAVVADGLHPSAAQYAEWLSRLRPAAEAALAR